MTKPERHPKQRRHAPGASEPGGRRAPRRAATVLLGLALGVGGTPAVLLPGGAARAEAPGAEAPVPPALEELLHALRAAAQAGDTAKFAALVRPAHRHLFPLSDWRFASPVSYWDPAHHGDVFLAAEADLVALGGLVLLRRRAPPAWRPLGAARSGRAPGARSTSRPVQRRA